MLDIQTRSRLPTSCEGGRTRRWKARVRALARATDAQRAARRGVETRTEQQGRRPSRASPACSQPPKAPLRLVLPVRGIGCEREEEHFGPCQRRPRLLSPLTERRAADQRAILPRKAGAVKGWIDQTLERPAGAARQQSSRGRDRPSFGFGPQLCALLTARIRRDTWTRPPSE